MRVLAVPAHAAALGLLALAALAALPARADAWVASPNSIASSPGALSPLSGPGPIASSTLDAGVPVAWPVASIAPPAEGCMSPALGVVKVLAVVLGALAAIKLPLVLAKLMLAKVLLLLPLALPLALPLLVPVMLIASMLPGMMGMDDSPASDAPTPGGGSAAPGVPPGGGPAGGGNASPTTPDADEMEARGLWVERCVQRVACQINAKGSRKECGRYRCAALDWLGGT
ncbi:uncharacterized protein LOC113204812 [Frankliniella occidentalis]|uniref:Uncharacterized protein LOC113204812 n=1 Tax=Frankliniella occidentalis TaxID=133901 RepID=A0A6J1S9I2_FRAOC|nr:uncharacterized protein LOC113204812 [Frankliniella occidentalis]